MFIPNTGKVLKIMGNRAQCMAQANDVAIPRRSQFILNPITAKVVNLQH